MYSNYLRSKPNRDETQELGRGIKSVTATYFSEEPFMVKQAEKIDAVTEQIIALHSRPSVNELTKVVDQYEDERDALTSAIETEVASKLNLRAFFPAKAEAAEILLKKFSETPVETYAANAVETNQINARITLCNTEECRSHFTTIGLLPVWDHFISTQKNYEEKSAEKDAAESLKLRGTLRTQTKEMKKIIDGVLSYLTVQSEDYPEIYEVPAKELAEVVNRVMTTALARETRRNNSDDQ